MTWLPFAVPALLCLACWAGWRGSVCFGIAGQRAHTDRKIASASWLRGMGYGVLVLFCAVVAGFVWGRLL